MTHLCFCTEILTIYLSIYLPILTKNSVVVYMLWFQTDVVSVNNETIVANVSYILYGARWTFKAFFICDC